MLPDEVVHVDPDLVLAIVAELCNDLWITLANFGPSAIVLFA